MRGIFEPKSLYSNLGRSRRFILNLLYCICFSRRSLEERSLERPSSFDVFSEGEGAVLEVDIELVNFRDFDVREVESGARRQRHPLDRSGQELCDKGAPWSSGACPNKGSDNEYVIKY